jgi:hypothetical protein
VGLGSALGTATKAVRDAFPMLHDYLLYSITPRVLKTDPERTALVGGVAGTGVPAASVVDYPRLHEGRSQ